MIRLFSRWNSTTPVEMLECCPVRFATLSVGEIEHLPIRVGNLDTHLGEVFRVQVAESGVPHIEIEGDCARIKRLGAAMSGGTLHIHSHVGMHAGAHMSGGNLQIEGNAADWLGAEMQSGTIQVRGSAANLVGAAYLGNPKGMSGGTILIHGTAGSEVGAKMRRGTIAVQGAIGQFAGVQMIAGSIFAFSGWGEHAGANLKRGTLFSAVNSPLPPTFHQTSRYNPSFLSIYFKKLRHWGLSIPTELDTATVWRYRGDWLALGQGEILVPV
ncbi:MAG: formylmethanofuran dehydrogenase subunit C [Zavarzinella sp.]